MCVLTFSVLVFVRVDFQCPGVCVDFQCPCVCVCVC